MIKIKQHTNLQEINIELIFVHIMYHIKKPPIFLDVFKCIQIYAINA